MPPPLSDRGLTRPVKNDPRDRWLARWLWAVAAFLSATGLAVAAVSGFRRGVLLPIIVIVGYLPFLYARRRLHAVVARRLERQDGSRGLLVAWSALGVACDVLMVAQLLTARAAGRVMLLDAPGLAWVGPVWFSAHGLLFLGYAFLGSVRGLTRLGERFAAWLGRARSAAREPVSPDPAESSLDVPPLSRRAFLQRTSLAGAAIPFGVSISGVGTSYDFRVEERDVELPNWPRALDGFRVAHLSDIHVGGAMDRERLLRIAELTNSARPDLVAHTGDFLTHRSGNFDAPLYEALAKIEAPYGQWGCLGNHDFDDAERLVGLLGDSGVRVLRDQLALLSIGGEAVEIAGLDYLSRGVDWTSGYRRLLASLRPREGAPRILLNHDPTAFVRLPEECADLVLSGHTHGGHVGVQLGQNHAITVVGLLGLPDQGVYQRGNMRLYVTRCVGFYGYPMRIGIPPEIALLRLRASVPTVTGPSSTETFIRDAADPMNLAAPASLFVGRNGASAIESAHRLAAATSIYGGTSEIMRSIVAQGSLGMPRSRS